MRVLATAALVVLLSVSLSAQVTHSICELQAYDSQGLSPLDGEIVDVRGVVTFPPGYLHPQYTSFFIQQDDCGISVFCFQLLGFSLSLGDSVHVHGELEEYVSDSTGAGATTEILVWDPSDIHVLSSGHPEPAPSDMSNAEIQNEWNEGRLVRATGVLSDTNYDYAMWLWDGESTLLIYRNNNDEVSFGHFWAGDTLRITGVLLQYDPAPPYFEGYELVPRFQSDIEHWQISSVELSTWTSIKALFH